MCLDSSEIPFVFRNKDPPPQVQGGHHSCEGFRSVSVERDREKMMFLLVCDKSAVKKKEGTFQRIKRSLFEPPDI